MITSWTEQTLQGGGRGNERLTKLLSESKSSGQDRKDTSNDKDPGPVDDDVLVTQP